MSAFVEDSLGLSATISPMAIVRGITGATVLAITREQQGLPVATAQEISRAGDVMALAGTHDAVDPAQLFLLGGSQEV